MVHLKLPAECVVFLIAAGDETGKTWNGTYCCVWSSHCTVSSVVLCLSVVNRESLEIGDLQGRIYI